MTVSIIIASCLLLLIAYVFDATSIRTKIPSIILLLLLGFGIKQLIVFFEFDIPDLETPLSILGTVGLILIVLEGSLELEIKKGKGRLISTSFVLAVLPLLIIAFTVAFSFQYYLDIPMKTALVNAIPLSIISSAIAIPSARNLDKNTKEFVTYESSLSDIVGVILFNFIALNNNIGSISFAYFLLELLAMLVVSLIATILMSFFISNSKHHIKFVPIILTVVLIYTISKIFHLPALIFILFFGLFLNNFQELERFDIIKRLKPDILEKEVVRFTDITTEFAFIIRSLFFLLFGFLIKLEDIINLQTLPWALGIVAIIFLSRIIFLKICRLSISPLLYIAPRGLITILLFLSIPINQKIELVNNALLIQVILICALIMMIGLMTKEEKPNIESEKIADENPALKIDE